MSHDLRQYARHTNFRLFVGFILILLIVGDGLIFLFYGRGAATMGLICILAGLAPILLITVALWIIDWIVKTNNINK